MVSSGSLVRDQQASIKIHCDVISMFCFFSVFVTYFKMVTPVVNDQMCNELI